MYIHSCDVYIVSITTRDLQGCTYSLWIGVEMKGALMNVIRIGCVNLHLSCLTFVE